jgi:hypothetical protein
MKWILLSIGAFVLAAGVGPWLMFRALGSEARAPLQPSSWSGGLLLAESASVQNPALQPERRLLLPSARADLVQSLGGLPPERFTVITGTDDDSHDVGSAIFDDLTRAGWTPVAAAVIARAPKPQRRGVTVYMNKPSASIDSLLNWLASVGLQPRLPGVVVKEDWPENVRIEVGDAP